MLSKNPTARRATKLIRQAGYATLAITSLQLLAPPASAQVSVGVDAGLLPNALCVGSTNGTTVFVSNSDDCATATGSVAAQYVQIGPSSSYAYFDAATGQSQFTGSATFENDADFNGTTQFSDVVSFSGPNTTFASSTFFTFGSTFQSTATFNGATSFTAAVTSANINNSGTINSTNVNATGSLTAAPGTTINMGGVNRIQGVAAGINALDAVNVSQLNAATSGITTNVTALQTLTATHTTQIAAIESTNTTQASQISALQAADTAFDSRMDALDVVTSNLNDRIGNVDDRASAGTAAAIALSGAMFLPGKSFNLTGNVGSYRGAHAAALQFGALVGDRFAINAGVTHGFNKGGKTGMRAGFTIGW